MVFKGWSWSYVKISLSQIEKKGNKKKDRMREGGSYSSFLHVLALAWGAYGVVESVLSSIFFYDLSCSSSCCHQVENEVPSCAWVLISILLTWWILEARMEELRDR